jgi:hypothetical protein
MYFPKIFPEKTHLVKAQGTCTNKNMAKKGIMSAWNEKPSIIDIVAAKTGRRFTRVSNMIPLNNLSNLPCQPSINHLL